MEGPTKYGMIPTLQQCLFSLDHVMCTEAQQQIYHSRCDHGCKHLHSADVQTLMLPSPKGVVRDNSCQTHVITVPVLCVILK